MKQQNGFSLLEILISVLVLSVGILGMAGLQVSSLKFNQTASIRSQATILAYEITDRMRTNRQAAQSGSYNTALTATTVSGSSRAQLDLNTWKQSLDSLLPDGRGSVQKTGDTVRIVIQWDESRLTGGSATQQLTFETRL